MTTIWKFDLESHGAPITMPKGAQLLSVMVQDEKPRVWALVDPKAIRVERRLAIIGTGWELETCEGTYLGSFQLEGGALVFHVFDLGEEAW